MSYHLRTIESNCKVAQSCVYTMLQMLRLDFGFSGGIAMRFDYDELLGMQLAEAAVGTCDSTRHVAIDDVATRNVSSWFGSILDDLAVGVALVDQSLDLIYANRCARAGLTSGKVLTLEGQKLSLGIADESRTFRRAVADAMAGKRSLLTLGHGLVAQSAAILPANWQGGRAAALVFERTKEDSSLALYFYARVHRLTGAEERLLCVLSQGLSVAEAADEVGCAIATARTHVRSVLGKTKQPSLRKLVSHLGGLPPVADRILGAAMREGG